MPRYETLDWYENALYYDMVFDADTPNEAAFLEAVHKRHGQTRGKRMLEPACGSGRLVAAMARRGYSVTGFDLCQPMLDFARDRLRKRKLNARLVNAPMEDFAFSRPFDIAHCLVSSFKHLLTEEAAQAHLRCMANALKPGGLYILALHLTKYSRRSCERERWVGRRRGTEVICNIQGWPPDRRKRQERVRARLNVTRNGQTRHYQSEWLFRTYSHRQLKALLARFPGVEHVATYDFNCDINREIALDESRYDVVLVLRKQD